MRVLVDTTIWSEALRRKAGTVSEEKVELERLVKAGLVELIGPIRQEILSGIKDYGKYELVRDRLRHFPDLLIGTEEYEEAASYCNICQSRGMQGSFIDFLICAVARKNDLAIYTTDKDFPGYAKVIPIKLYQTQKPS